MSDVILTQRLVLRPLRTDDVDELVALDNDPDVMRYLSGGKPSVRKDVEDFVMSHLGSRWMVYERVTSDFVGWFGARSTDVGQFALGYRLARRHWGKGLATEGTRALIDKAFSSWGASRVWAETMAANIRSRMVMERCGLKSVRTFHLRWEDPIEGAELGEVEYELLRRDWEILCGDAGPSC